MILPVYAIWDEKASSFNNIVVSSNDYVIQRSFAETVISGSDRLMKFSPRDFILYRIGKFNTGTGEMIPESPVVRLVDGSEVVNVYGNVEKG